MMYLAKYESRNFTFQALADTDTKARAALMRGLDIHARQYGLAPEWWRKYENDFNVTPIAVGECYRDYEVLT